MDINEAALKLAKIEIIKSQVEHLQNEADSITPTSDPDELDYATHCNNNAQELIRMLNVNSMFQ